MNRLKDIIGNVIWDTDWLWIDPVGDEYGCTLRWRWLSRFYLWLEK